jgi:hypothetical protein
MAAVLQPPRRGFAVSRMVVVDVVTEADRRAAKGKTGKAGVSV